MLAVFSTRVKERLQAKLTEALRAQLHTVVPTINAIAVDMFVIPDPGEEGAAVSLSIG